MSECYQELIEACENHEQCRTQATSLSSVKELQNWHVHKPRMYIKDLSDQDIESFHLPASSKPIINTN
jgi:hypothetical protein